MNKPPQTYSDGYAWYRGIKFRARLLATVRGKTGLQFIVTALNEADWRRLPASSVVVDPKDFTPDAAGGGA